MAWNKKQIRIDYQRCLILLLADVVCDYDFFYSQGGMSSVYTYVSSINVIEAVIRTFCHMFMLAFKHDNLPAVFDMCHGVKNALGILTY